MLNKHTEAWVLTMALVLLTGCAGTDGSHTVDAEPRDDPATPPPQVSTPLPYPLQGEAVWTSPFSSEPKAAGSSFVGLIQPREGGNVHFLGVDRTGRTRWSTERDPDCTGFAVTRIPDDEIEAVVLLNKERDPDQGFLATQTSAAAYDPDSGQLVWGPIEVPGTLVGPGLVFAAIQGSVMSDQTGPKVVLDAGTGQVVADEHHGDTVLHEHHGMSLIHRDGALRALGPEGEKQWNHTDLVVPPQAGTDDVRVGYGPRPASDSAAAVVLEWTINPSEGADSDEATEPVLYTVHDLRTGERVLTLGPGREPYTLGDNHGRTVVLADPVSGGEPHLYALGPTESALAWERSTEPDERLRDLVGGILYTTDGEDHWAFQASTGKSGHTGAADTSDLIPAAVLDGGPAVLAVPTANDNQVFAALPVQ